MSFFSEEGEIGPLALGGWGSGGILAPGETCMLASWAAYSCCREVEKPAKALTSKSSKHSKFYILSFPLPRTFSASLSAFISLSLSFTSFLSFHEAGREPPSKVLTVFQRLNPERDSSLKNHTEMAFIQNTWSPYFPLITEKSLPTGRKCVSKELSFL